jgi:molybdopterin molybdotransferase
MIEPMDELLHPDTALEMILAATRPLAPVLLPLEEALDHVAAEDVRAGEDIPLTDISAMDGFAVRAADVERANPSRPVRLEVIDYIPAGSAPGKPVGAGQAVRIMTGGALPAGADCIVKQEDTHGAESPDAKSVEVVVPGETGLHIFAKGEDIRSGDLLVQAGTLLRPQELGVLASVGIAKIKVHPRPKVAVLATGDELVPAHEPVSPGKIRSSNSLTLVGQARRYGGVAMDLGIAKDDLKVITDRLRSASDARIVITSGGSAKGDRDYSEQAMLNLGVKVKFHRVAIKPGKPVLFGVKDDTLFFGLPGNPVASMLTFELFVRPALLKMRGLSRLAKREVWATLEDEVVKRERGKRYYIRVRYSETGGEPVVRSTGNQGSSVLSSMSKANAVLVLDMDQGTIAKGSRVMVWLMDEPEV